ncbi:MAG: peptidoglycan DD-metalloendopeptidase family protein [Pseudomonadota bacterium]|nr:peptidoglycan DD-metalloendopeptidase family protein [Pseudomonadota bacterium]
MPLGTITVAFFAMVVIVLGLSGCGSTGPAPVDSRDAYGPAPSGYYRIRNGDTLYAIAFRRGVDFRNLASWNGIQSPYRIYAGKLLRVEPPEGTVRAAQGSGRPTPSSTSIASSGATGAKRSQGTTQPSKPPPEKAVSGLRWTWPLKGKVVQTYRRGDRTRQGVRIAGRAGQRVTAAEGGTVVYSGSGLKGYGNLIILKHNDKYLSAYGFNRRLLVKEGERVKRGQSVAEVGQASGGEYLLHFEIRKNGVANDPLRYLPGS